MASVPPTPTYDPPSFSTPSPVPRRSHERKQLSTVSSKSLSSIESERSHKSHRSQSSMSSIDSEYKLEDSSSIIQEISPAIPNRILASRIRQSAPIIDITPEVDTVVTKSTYFNKGPKDVYITSAVTVQIPSDNQQLSPTTQNSHQRLQDSEYHRLVTNYIQDTIADWKNLDFSRFGKIRLCDKFYISPDEKNWQKLDCYLFETILVLVRRYPDGRPPQVKGSVAVTDHLLSIALPPTGSRKSHHLQLNLSTESLPVLHMKTSDSAALENWYAALVDKNAVFAGHRLVPSDDAVGQHLVGGDCFHKLPTSSHMPTDTVILVPLSGSPNGSKLPAIRNTIHSVMREMTLFDRVSIVPYGGPQQYLYGLAYNTWKPWRKVVDSLKPTASSGSRSDLFAGITTALNVLADRTTRNPVSNIFIISDSLAEFSASDIEAIADRAEGQNVKLHVFGVSNHHSVDILEEIVSKCSGNYHYLRMWDELHPIMIGQFRSIQSYTHCNLSLSLETRVGVSIVSIAGHNPNVGLRSKKVPENSGPFTPTSYTTENMSSGVQLVEMGDMTASEQRTFLVQVRISGDALPLEVPGNRQQTSVPFELFSAMLMFSSFAGPAESCRHKDVFFLPVGSAAVRVESLNAFIQDLIQSPQLAATRGTITGGEVLSSKAVSNSSSAYSSNSLPPSPAHSCSHQSAGPQIYVEEVSSPPSIVYGDFIAGQQESSLAPMYLSLEKCDIRVVQRRIQLTAINILEYIVRTDVRSQGAESLIKSINSARAVIAGLLACANTSYSERQGLRMQGPGTPHSRDKQSKSGDAGEWDKLRAISVEVNRLVEILDNMLATACEEAKEGVAFEEDYRKLLIQNIGILRAEKGYSLRTPLEGLFLQRQSVNNVI